jgi:hypothetical protein
MNPDNRMGRLRATVSVALLVCLATGCVPRREPAAPRPAQRKWTTTTRPTPADDYLAAELGHMAVEDQERCAASAERRTRPQHRDSPMRPPGR